jgi:outer membrane protein
MKKLFLILLTAGSLLIAKESKAQLKLGYVNSTDVLLAMPESKTMEQTLKKKSDEYQAQLEKMYADYYKKVDDFTAEREKLSAPIQEIKMKDLQNTEKMLKDFEGTAQEDIQKMQQQLLVPIQEKAINAVKAVAKENGYNYIFDITSGALVVQPEGDDITPLVKKKLGIVDAPKTPGSTAPSGSTAPKTPTPTGGH